jgi:hypothetical protein
VVTDNQLGVVGGGTLAPGQSAAHQEIGVAGPGQYSNLATVVATNVECGIECVDEDPSHYFGAECDIDVEKSTNGEDADTPTGPCIPVGAPVTWDYVVTNNGNVTVDYVLTDSVLGGVGAGTLAPGQSAPHQMVGVAQLGQYSNLATVVATNVECGIECVDEDPSHYFGAECDIDVEKSTNGQDADTPTGPEIPVGDPVVWEYVVTNNGNVTVDYVLTDDKLGAIGSGTLTPGQSATLSASGTAQLGQYSNLATVVATNVECGIECEDKDPSHYIGVGEPQGCTPGYWKNLRQHGGAWNYDPDQSVESVFGDVDDPFIIDGDETLHEALNGGGGDTCEEAFNQLMFHAVAALLNMAHPDINYQYPGGIPFLISEVQRVNNLCVDGDPTARDEILELKSQLGILNEAGCPIGRVPLDDMEPPGKSKKAPARQMSEGNVLGQNVPNPFNPETWIPFKLAKAADVKIEIYDVSGRLVRRLDLGYRSAGSYWNRSRSAYWDGLNKSGEYVSSGIYFYVMTAGEFSAVRRMTILK